MYAEEGPAALRADAGPWLAPLRAQPEPRETVQPDAGPRPGPGCRPADSRARACRRAQPAPGIDRRAIEQGQPGAALARRQAGRQALLMIGDLKADARLAGRAGRPEQQPRRATACAYAAEVTSSKPTTCSRSVACPAACGTPAASRSSARRCRARPRAGHAGRHRCRTTRPRARSAAATPVKAAAKPAAQQRPLHAPAKPRQHSRCAAQVINNEEIEGDAQRRATACTAGKELSGNGKLIYTCCARTASACPAS